MSLNNYIDKSSPLMILGIISMANPRYYKIRRG